MRQFDTYQWEEFFRKFPDHIGGKFVNFLKQNHSTVSF